MFQFSHKSAHLAIQRLNKPACFQIILLQYFIQVLFLHFDHLKLQLNLQSFAAMLNNYLLFYLFGHPFLNQDVCFKSQRIQKGAISIKN